MIQNFTFGKAERLTHRKQIDALFREGRNFYLSPFKVIYSVTEPVAGPEVKILVAVAKKKYKKAVDRNTLKRLIREAYRLHKQKLSGPLMTSTFCLHIAFIYVGDKADITFGEIEKQMIGCLERLATIACSGV